MAAAAPSNSASGRDGSGSERQTVRASIRGVVQGVFYRAWTKETADSLGLDGWVRNLPDGSVEAVFSGPSSSVDQMLTLSKRGPKSARVEQVDVEPYKDDVGKGFEVKRGKY
ncbi:acylphosphatase [Klebsormidium nitens]|uniref:acylphosphatase n=1 Tax=Klebsormidium nitens TaxID=105231 RepID=A0A1Y1HH10_KLENI|nr:acylphosphatase [Klebsormidium nitens]|eukprot:GAQ77710.1 acylphosphatase [Klebsormidium nitens]